MSHALVVEDISLVLAVTAESALIEDFTLRVSRWHFSEMRVTGKHVGFVRWHQERPRRHEHRHTALSAARV